MPKNIRAHITLATIEMGIYRQIHARFHAGKRDFIHVYVQRSIHVRNHIQTYEPIRRSIKSEMEDD
jgi:hypothetical protein